MCLLSAFFKVPIIGFLESEEKEVFIYIIHSIHSIHIFN